MFGNLLHLYIYLSSIMPFLIPLNYFVNSASSPSKRNFCHIYSVCRIQAQRELDNCAGGTISALMARSEELEIGKAEGSPEGNNHIGEEEENAGSREKCLKEMAPTIGRSIHILYARTERKALKCAEGMASREAELDGEKLVQCQAAQLEMNWDSDSFPIPSAFYFSKKGKNECWEAYKAELGRCRKMQMCCSELDRCLATIQVESNIRAKEQRALRMMDKCMNEVPLRSADIIFTTNLTIESLHDTSNDSRSNNKQTEQIDQPGPVPIIASPTPSPAPPPPPILSAFNLESVPDSVLSFIPSSPTTTSTMIPPPDPTLRNILDFIFPGLAINGQRRSMAKPPNTVGIERTSPKKSKQIGSFLLEEIQDSG